MLKKFEEFSFEDQLDQDLKDNDLVKQVEQAVKNVDSRSFSHLAAATSRRRNPNEDLNALLAELEKEGWSVEKIKIALKNEKTKSRLEADNGLTDLFLFHFTNGEWDLSGGDQNSQESGWGLGDLIVKYSYGYHKTLYGLLYLQQNFKNETELYHYLAVSFLPYFFSYDLARTKTCELLQYQNNHHIQGVNFFKPCYKFHLDEKEMIINMKDVYNLLVEKNMLKPDTSYEKFYNTFKEDVEDVNNLTETQFSKTAFIVTFGNISYDKITYNKLK